MKTITSKFVFLTFLIFFTTYIHGQCTSGCNYTITVPNNGTHNLTAGQVVCITGTGSFTGTLNNFNGNTLCIGPGVTYNPSTAPNYNGNWSISNYGIFTNIGNLNFISGTNFYNGTTGSISLPNLTVNSGVSFVNEGLLTITGNTLINSGASSTFGGTSTLNGTLTNNGTITVSGIVTANGITNNATGRIIGGNGLNCNSIRSTGSFTNNGVYGGSGSGLYVGNTGGTISSPAITGLPTAPTSQPSIINLTLSGTTINGSFAQASTSVNGYVILRAISAGSAPATTNPTNMATLIVGQNLGSWTVVAINNGQTSTTFTDNVGVTCNSVYYRIYSFNTAGSSLCRVYNTSGPLTGSYNFTPSISSTTPGSRIGAGTVSLAASANFGTVNWFANSTGGSVLATSTSFLTPSIAATTTYFVEAVNGTCTSSSRVAINATINYVPEIEVSGNNIEIIDGSTSPSLSNDTDFGSTDVTLGTITKIYTIKNLGNANLTISNPTVIGTHASNFTVTTFPSMLTIIPGDFTTFSVTFDPSATGTRNATIIINNNDSDENPYDFAIRGVGTNAEIDIKGNNISIPSGSTIPLTANWTDFGSLDITSGILSRTFTIFNTGTTVLTISNPVISGVNAGDFAITTNPASPLTINAGSNKTFVVRFDPVAIGIRTAIISIVNDDYDENPYTFKIQGNGTDAEIDVTGNNNLIVDGSTTVSVTNDTDFGSTDITLGTVTKTYTITNLGTTNLTLSNPTLIGNNFADFSISSNPGSLDLAPGSSTTFSVTFDPMAIGARITTVNIINNDANENPYDFRIQGVGTNAEIDVRGNSVSIVSGSMTPTTSNWTDFGSVNYGTGTISRTFTIYNTGTTSLSISNPIISGANPNDFNVFNPSGTVFNANSNRTFVIRFNPSSAGFKSAIITIPNTDYDENPYVFAIQAIAKDVEINVLGGSVTIENNDTTPSIFDNTSFGNVPILSGSISKTYTIENHGVTPLTISNPVVQGPNSNDFIITTPPTTLTIPGGGSTSFTITFSTSVLGQRNAIISIANDDLDENPYVFFINGFGDKDSDGDGISDYIDLDDDNDGITDAIECKTCATGAFQNGSFENPIIPAASYSIRPTSTVPGWQTSAENFIEIWSTGFQGVPSAHGNQFAELNANIPGILYQTFCLNGAGGTISWSIKHRGRAGVDQAFVKFGSSIGDAIASTPIAVMVDGNTAWGTYSGLYSIPVGQTQIVLTFQAGYTASGSQSVGNFIDDVQIVINQKCIDTDGDGIEDIADVDDDNDGIPSIEEASFKAFSSKKGTFDMTNPALWKDVNNNGLNDYIEALIANGTYIIPDTDNDLVPDYLDLDSDNDSVFDTDESGLLNGDGDINGDGVGDLSDADGDGLLDLFDNLIGYGCTNRAYAQDTDSNGIPDYLQLKSDGITFDISKTLYANLDANNDGKIDGFGDLDRDGITDTYDTDSSKRGSPRDLNRKLFLDFDGRNDYAENVAILGGLPSASLMAWIDLNPAYSGFGNVVGQSKFQIRITSARKLSVILNSTTLVCNTVTLNTAQWYHVGATYDGSTLKLFLNGNLVASQAVTGAIQSDTSKLTLGRNPIGTNFYFKGKIDEVRVFNVALTDTQYKKIVYQEINNNNAQVRGEIIPRDVEGLSYSSLLRYYRMDAYKDDIVDDLTTPSIDTGIGMKMYNHKIINYQQAPMPFVTRQNGTFATAVTDSSKDIRGLDILENDASIIQVKHNITEPANVTTVGLFVEPGITVNMTNNTKIQNEWYLKLDGKIDLVDKSQLLQTEQSELDVTSIGFIERDQKGQTNKFNYNYWTSPVSSINSTTINHGFTVAGVMKDGTNPNSIQNLQWTAGVNSSATSPITLSSYWIFKFQNLGNNYYNWASVGQNGLLLPGQGYTLKGSNAATANQNYTFVGKPNNGTITSSVGANNLLLAGNPYPSAIDANKFIEDNAGTITGTIYFWEHYNSNNSHNTVEYQGGYATYNKTGGTAPVAPAIVSGLGSSSKTPNRFIPVGQGFFVTGSATGGTLTFNNSQRLFIKEDDLANSFTLFRTNIAATISSSITTNNAEDTFTQEQFMKIRLGYNSANNLHRQILLGFMNQNATSSFDNGYDAISIETLSNDMYFINGTDKLNINGEGYFNVNNIYPLGIKNSTAGNVTFMIDAKENMDNNQEIYIHDNVTNTYNSIKNQNFQINLPAGTYENRFSLRFTNGTTSLGINDNEITNGITIKHSQVNKILNIKNQSTETIIKSVTLYNVLGQKVTSWNIENQEQNDIKLSLDLIKTGTYIVKVITDKGEISKKIAINSISTILETDEIKNLCNDEE